MSKKLFTIIPALVVMAIFVWCTNVLEAQIVLDGLIGFWTFDKSDIKGNTAEDILGGNDGTIEGGAGEAEGKIEEGLEFDGADDYVNCGADAGLNLADGITVEAWVKATIDKQYLAVMDRKYNDNDGSWGLYLGSGEVVFATALPGDRIRTSVAFNYAGDWHHIVGTFSLSERIQKVYIDGELRAEDQRDTALQEPTHELTIGSGRLPDFGNYFTGIIDEVKIYDRALSEAEIQQNYGATHNTMAVEPADKLAVTWGKIKVKN